MLSLGCPSGAAPESAHKCSQPLATEYRDWILLPEDVLEKYVKSSINNNFNVYNLVPAGVGSLTNEAAGKSSFVMQQHNDHLHTNFVF